MKKKLLKREITICVSIAFVLYGLYILLGFWLGRVGYLGAEQAVLFPVISFGYMWFVTKAYGSLRALPALLFCMLIEMFSTRKYIDITILWWWMQLPQLWGPIVGYAVGSLTYSLPRDKVTLWISIGFAAYAVHILLGFWLGYAEGGEQWYIFPAVALLYVWFIAQRYGPLWALPALLFCLLVEVFSTRNDIDISILWTWVDGPTLYGPIVGYVMGSLIYGAASLFRAVKKRTAK